MKNLLTLFCALFAFTALADIGPINRSTNLEIDDSIQPGTLEKHFINVINNSGSAFPVGAVVVQDLTDDDGASVTTTTTQNALPLCVITAACANNALCKNCQTYGLNSSVLYDSGAGTATAGLGVYLSGSNAGYVASPAHNLIGSSFSKIGAFYDTSTTSGSVEVFLKLR